MKPFVLLRDPESYTPCWWDLGSDDERQLREYWLDHFARHIEDLLSHQQQVMLAHQYENIDEQLDTYRREFQAMIDTLRNTPRHYGHLDIVKLDYLRQDLLTQMGFPDAYALVKQQENAAAIDMYPDVIAELDRQTGYDLIETLFRNVFTGNLFDMGTATYIAIHDAGGVDFVSFRDEHTRRPWLVDDFDAFADRLRQRPCHKTLMLVDNAGTDAILGMIPLARHMAGSGTRVVLAANDEHALNDITTTELRGVMDTLSTHDPTLAAMWQEGMIQVCGTGNGIPLIDLSGVSDELNRHAADADLLVLEGMGRAVESNWHIPFTVDTLKIALLKLEPVAQRLGGTIFDAVCRYEPAPLA